MDKFSDAENHKNFPDRRDDSTELKDRITVNQWRYLKLLLIRNGLIRLLCLLFGWS